MVGTTAVPPLHRFFRHELRTTDVESARRFYAAVLGREVADVSLLPAETVARGARPHWLGHIAVADVEQTARAFVEHGASRLGPTRPQGGGSTAILRDPGGAVVALTSPATTPTEAVVWQLLNTPAVERCLAAYGALFGWQATERQDLGALGTFQLLAWAPGEPAAASMVDITGLPGRHPHWLFHFPVADVEAAAAAVRSGGGVVAGIFDQPGGDRVAVCDDAQGAAFTVRPRALRHAGALPPTAP
jgi:predicted enzyme related to lactoylglutathione lyase